MIEKLPKLMCKMISIRNENTYSLSDQSKQCTQEHSTLSTGFPVLRLPWLLLLVTIFFSTTSTISAGIIPRFGVHPRGHSEGIQPSMSSSSTFGKDRITFSYTQTLDHFNYRPDSYATFQQRYMINFKYWGGANTSSPIFVYLGAEGSIEGELDSILNDYAPQFRALLLHIEHRYYGESMPFGSSDQAFSNTSTLGYFNSAQALADYAELIVSLKNNLSAESCPVIVVGGSYGGILAFWFRLKYPHIAFGALASSAPFLDIVHVEPPEQYYSIVTKDFREVSEICYATIRRSWAVIDEVASSNKDGLSYLAKRFNSCKPINTSSELKDYLEKIYCDAAQYGGVEKICYAMENVPKDVDLLTGIISGVVAYQGQQTCYDLNYYNHPTKENLGWEWQTCTDLISPINRTGNTTMFEPWTLDLQNIIELCRAKFGVTVTPRPQWIVTEFGGDNIELTLERFGSNIIFSNGGRDPWSFAGVLHNISNSLVALYTTQGSHCMDLCIASEEDPKWLLEQRASEMNIMRGWIANYKSMNKKKTVSYPMGH